MTFSGGGSGVGGRLHARRQRDAGGAQRQAGRGAWSGAEEEALTLLLDLGLGQRVEIGEDLGPRAVAAECGDAIVQGGLEHESQETAKHVPANGLVELVEDRARGEQVLLRAEGLLDGPKLLVF